MNGADSLAHTFVNCGVKVCFTNPGTSEMHFVSALDRIDGIRCVLGLFEGVVTGAADGYFRMTGTPAATLLHLGPGLANGLANLHNARKARSGIVNVVGDHATYHLKLDAPLTSDIAAIAATMSDWVHSSQSPNDVANDAAQAVAQARTNPGKIATLILPADTAWGAAKGAATAVESAKAPRAKPENVEKAAAALREVGGALLLSGSALRGRALELAGHISAATGCRLLCENLNARLERGAGRVKLERIPYAVDLATATLKDIRQLVLVGAKAPVAFFAYPDKPSILTAKDTTIVTLATPEEELTAALEDLAAALDAINTLPNDVEERIQTSLSDGAISHEGIATTLAVLLPEHAIVVDESITTGRRFSTHLVGARPHDWLNSMGGSIGFGLPLAVGAALGTPDRKVIALEGDGSAMYTPQALWSMAREDLDVLVIVFVNHAYQILQGEYANVGAGKLGQRAKDMLTLDRPLLDWQALARGHGIESARANDLGEFADGLRQAFSRRGPFLLEVNLAS